MHVNMTQPLRLHKLSSAVMASTTPQGARRPRSKRPAMISELAERARDHNWDENGSMKYYLRLAEKDRRDGVTFANNKDLENSFVTFARAASLILEKIPSHRDYSTALNAAQRSNLAMASDFPYLTLSRLMHVCRMAKKYWTTWAS